MKSRLLNILVLALLPALFVSTAANAAPVIAEQILFDSGDDKKVKNIIGFSVAIDGEWAFVGAPADHKKKGKNYCQVYVYKFDYLTGLWGDGGGAVANPSIPIAGLAYTTLREKGDCKTDEFGGFGASISASNGLLAVGAPLAKEGGKKHDKKPRGGKIFFYQYDPNKIGNKTGGWVQNTSVGFPRTFNGTGQEIDDIQANAEFGSSVSVRYDPVTDTAILLAGAPLYDATVGVDTGRVYFYLYDGATNTVTFINNHDGEAAGDNFGIAVTSNGGLALIGAPLNGGTNRGAAFVYNFGTSPQDPINLQQTISPGIGGSLTSDNHHLGISVSLSPSPDSVMIVGGGDGDTPANGGAYVLMQAGSTTSDPYVFDVQTVGTAGGDVSQDGDTAGFGYQGISTNLYYDHQNIDSANPQWKYSKAETEYGRDISVSGTRVMVNGNGNTSVGDGKGVAYAYYTPCGAGGSLKANEWAMIGLQCDISTAITGGLPANIDEIFGPDLGIYDTNWVMYKQNGADYEGHQNAYVKLASTDVLVQGQGYWIISDADKKWQVNTPLAATQTPVEADPLPGQSGRENVAAVHSVAVKTMLNGLVIPTANIKVMFSNPFPSAIDLSKTLFRESSGSSTIAAKATFFEALDTPAYVYKTGVGTQNGYQAVSTTGTPGIPWEINPGVGFFVRFSNTFYTDILQDSGVTVADFLFSQSK